MKLRQLFCKHMYIESSKPVAIGDIRYIRLTCLKCGGSATLVNGELFNKVGFY